MKKEIVEKVEVADLLPDALKESLSQLHLDTLQEAFDKLVEAKVQGKLGEAVKSAEINFDEHVNSRLIKLVEKMEESHKAGFVKAYDALNERVRIMREKYEKRIADLKAKNASLIAEKKEASKQHKVYSLKESASLSKHYRQVINEHDEEAKKAVVSVIGTYEKRLDESKRLAVKGMLGVKDYYEKKVLKEAKAFKRNLVESLQAYLNKEIDFRVPYNDIREAVRNNTAMTLVENLKQILSIDAIAKTKALKAPINEACQIITETKKNNASLLTENKKLRNIIRDKEEALARQINENKEKINKAKQIIAEAKRVAHLNEKLASLPSIEQRNFVKNLLKGQSIEFINENWDYTVKQYRAKEAKERAILAEKAMAERKSRQIAEFSRRRLTEATRNVREAREEQQSPTDVLIDTIISDSQYDM